MATITKGYSFGATELVTNSKLHSLVDDASIANIATADIADSNITNAKISDVSGAKFTNLANIPSGSGLIPVANLPVGTTASKIVQLDGSAKLPAVDGSQLTGVVATVPSAGSSVQVVNTQTGADATGTTTMPNDDSIPQKTEGDEYMTLAITPTSATNILKIDVVFFGNEDSNVSNVATVALFQDDTVGALAAGQFGLTQNQSQAYGVSFTYWMTAGTTSATTFKVRAGMNSGGTFRMNGGYGSRQLGGVLMSSITITEIKV